MMYEETRRNTLIKCRCEREYVIVGDGTEYGAGDFMLKSKWRQFAWETGLPR